MKKTKLIIVFGSYSGIEKFPIYKAKDFGFEINYLEYIFAEQMDSLGALNAVNKAVKSEIENRGNVIVVYVGSNLQFIEKNISYPSFDMGKLLEKIIEVVGGYDEPAQKEIVDKMFIGALLNLIDYDTVLC